MSHSLAYELSALASKHFIPLDVTWEITKSCNLRCPPCYIVKRPEKELTLSEGMKLIKDLSKRNTLYITFTGGEPFLRKAELKKWAFTAQDLGMVVSIFTNGTLIKKNDISWLKELMPFAVHISIFSIQKSVHDKITGDPGSYDGAVKVIGLLRSVGIEVVMKTLLMKDNFIERKKIIEFAGKLGVSWSIDPVVTPMENGDSRTKKFSISNKQVDKLFKETAGYFASRFYPSSKNEFLCGAGANMAAISAYGDVYPCLMYTRSVGSVREKGFSDIWDDSILLKKLRMMTTKDLNKCPACDMLKYCSRCPGLAMTEDGDEFGASSSSCMLARATKKVVTKK